MKNNLLDKKIDKFFLSGFSELFYSKATFFLSKVNLKMNLFLTILFHARDLSLILAEKKKL